MRHSALSNTFLLDNSFVKHFRLHRGICGLPNGAHDDQVEAMTQALLRWNMVSDEIVVLPEPSRISAI